MCAGKFLDTNEIEGSEGISQEGQQQVALGCQTGAIYLMNNFEVYTEEFGNIGLPLTEMRCLASTDQQDDLILCAGHFNSLIVLKRGKVRNSLNLLNLGSITNMGQKYIYIYAISVCQDLM